MHPQHSRRHTDEEEILIDGHDPGSFLNVTTIQL